MTARKQTRKPIAKKRFHEKIFESDSTYFLKLVSVCILATVWLKFNEPLQVGDIMLHAFPLGLPLGLLVVRAFEHHQEDRKIWYAVLVLVGIVSAIIGGGIYL